jgi:hypothetical protein
MREWRVELKAIAVECLISSRLPPEKKEIPSPTEGWRLGQRNDMVQPKAGYHHGNGDKRSSRGEPNRQKSEIAAAHAYTS